MSVFCLNLGSSIFASSAEIRDGVLFLHNMRIEFTPGNPSEEALSLVSEEKELPSFFTENYEEEYEGTKMEIMEIPQRVREETWREMAEALDEIEAGFF